MKITSMYQSQNTQNVGSVGSNFSGNEWYGKTETERRSRLGFFF
jgi:hypothetical protein